MIRRAMHIAVLSALLACCAMVPSDAWGGGQQVPRDKPGQAGYGPADPGDVTTGLVNPAVPEVYTLDYPAAERFCPPVRSTFYEVTRTVERVGGRTFRHPLNGGFGFVMPQKVDGKPLIHVGADLGWFRVGAPVFAVANGIVRISAGPVLPKAKKSQSGKTAEKGSSEAPEGFAVPSDSGLGAPWGNLVVIEHKLPDEGGYVTTIYGHLGRDRLVKTGELVRAGQQIGTIGRQHRYVNGGYKPHLHFGVRRGRMAEVGRVLFPLKVGENVLWAKLAAVDGRELEVELSGEVPPGLTELAFGAGGTTYTFRRKGDRFTAPARLLWGMPTNPDFPLVGYTVSTEGFLDPVGFLRRYGADRLAAPFRPAGDTTK